MIKNKQWLVGGEIKPPSNLISYNHLLLFYYYKMTKKTKVVAKVKCPNCRSVRSSKNGKTPAGKQKFKCSNCWRYYIEQDVKKKHH